MWHGRLREVHTDLSGPNSSLKLAITILYVLVLRLVVTSVISGRTAPASVVKVTLAGSPSLELAFMACTLTVYCVWLSNPFIM